MPGKRSPSFPFINLREALARAKVLYGAERRNEAPLESAARHWGYSPNSSATNRTVAALVAFGLLEMKDGKARLTDRAVHILADEREPSPDRERLIQEAARLPNLHRKLWDRYQGDLPSDATLRHYLITAEGFGEGSAAVFIRLFRETLELVGLGGQPGARQRESVPSPAATKQAPPSPRGQPSEVSPAVFPLLGDNEIEFRIRHRISSEEAEDVRKVFEIWLRMIVQH
jgi:hypothetical protein